MRKQHVATIREEGTSLLEVCCFHKALGAHCSPLNDVMGMHCATDVLHYQMMPILYHLGVRVLNGIVFIFLRGPPPPLPFGNATHCAQPSGHILQALHFCGGNDLMEARLEWFILCTRIYFEKIFRYLFKTKLL